MNETIKNTGSPVLLVDDEVISTQGMEIALRTGGVSPVLQCNDSRLVQGLLSKNQVACMVMDLSMPYVSGEQLLGTVMRDFADVPVIVVTGNDDLEVAVRCMKSGAFDYIVKPVAKERLVSAVKRAMEMRALRRENRDLRDHVLSSTLAHPECFSAFDTASPKMMLLFRYVESIAKSREAVLITGETGVGKEIMAKCLARLCGLPGAFVTVNVAGLDENAFSDALFGHRKGAYTGAVDVREGFVEKARDGVLFLDEIGDLDMAMQVKLLRLLQEHEFFPLGSDTPKLSTARVMVATNKLVDQLQNPEAFRADLFYRLRRHHVHIPPLRERPEDVPLLFNSILDRVVARLDVRRPQVPKDVFTALAGYSFPGNVRELESMVHDAFAGCRGGRMSAKFFHEWISHHQGRGVVPVVAQAVDSDPGARLLFPGGLPTLKEVQDLVVKEALKRAGDNQAVAARMLGITRQALNKRLLLKNEARMIR